MNKNSAKIKQGKLTCSSCGEKHIKKDCPHKDVICHRCNKSGHFARRCLSQPKGERGERKHKTSQINNVKQVSHDNPIMINVRLNGIPMELNTASGTSFITSNAWKKLGCPKLHPSKKFKTYTGQKFESRGTFLCTIEHNQQTVSHQIHVSEGSCLFGRDLLRKIQMDWTGIKKQCSQVCRISNELSLTTLLKEYSDVFDQPVETIKDFKAKLMLKEDATPRFFKPRPIPFVLRDKVDEELEKMEKSGVISRIETSEWASPLVVVPKPNRTIRITEDFKRTINNQLHVQQYPLARVEEIFGKISGGQAFTKLDGPDAFHQVEVEESCKKYLVINTHRGLYRYNILPQGIASSPAIFQELMDRILKGIPMTGSFVDDTISTGKDD
ncbi:uncharacterized protein K02A2.6-like [Mycetomoellerius zeteki]|uniref:uncharacterized protein K02A2.6-like n=1 Tax=Mycetomoellerius zeteki TaxID=64791 RepID=UPI00084EB115|nr:PREDICTED: uncharacterized protein K02A2.6-like [Trachymyrmex zeteki]